MPDAARDVAGGARFVHRFDVAYGDCDPAGNVFTPRFADYAVDTLYAFLRARLGAHPIRWLDERGLLPPARALSLEFLAVVRWDDALDVAVTAVRLGRTSLTVAMEGVRRSDGRVAFTAETTVVIVALDSRTALPVPDALRAALAADLAAAP